MNRTECSSCGGSDLQLVLDLGMSPIADAYTSYVNAAPPRYPLQVVRCTGCHLVQLLSVLSQDVLFGTGYSFYSSASRPLSNYHAAYAEYVLREHSDLITRSGVVEIGCNDGDMLRWFDSNDVAALGVDPSGGPVKVARDRGLTVINEPFTTELAAEIIDSSDRVGVIIANHVLAHVESVSDVLHGIAKLLAHDGVAYVEVQYLPDLILNNAFDLVYHEHRNFFSLTTLASAARRWGLVTSRATLTERQGGSLRVALTHSGQPDASVERLLASERWLLSADAYGGLQGRAERMRDRLIDLVRSCPVDEIIGYGAPAKATTLLNFCGLTARDIPCVIDTTPAKQGRYIPGADIFIIPPLVDSDIMRVTTALLLAWNYAGPIMRQHTEFTQRGGRWIVPVPSPMII